MWDSTGGSARPTQRWAELRIELPRNQQDQVLLIDVAPFLEDSRRSNSSSNIFYIRERKGPTEVLRVWAPAGPSSSVDQLARRLIESGRASPGAIELVEDSALDFADGTYSGPRAGELIGGLLSETTPLLLKEISRTGGNPGKRNDVGLELMVSHLEAANFFATWPDRYAQTKGDTGWPRIFVVFRSHADGFVIMTKDPKSTLSAMDRQYERMGARLRDRIIELLDHRVPSLEDHGAGATWYRIARRYLLAAEEALRHGDLTVRWEDGYLGDTHDLSASPFHQVFQNNEQLRRFQRTDLGFQAMRFTMSALYLVLSNLGIRLIDRYFLCHAISRTCQEHYGVDPTDIVLSQVSRLRSENGPG